jgi:hypothetical protein
MRENSSISADIWSRSLEHVGKEFPLVESDS